MIIDQLPELTNTFDTDEIPIERGTNTYKTKISTFFSGLRDLIAARVAKSGDTMTGDLNFNSDTHPVLKTLQEVGNPPSSLTYTSQIVFNDKNNTQYAQIRGRFGADGMIGLQFGGSQAGTNNLLALNVNANGEREIQISQARPWLKAFGLGTDGAFPITVAQGGSGCTAVESETTMSNVLTAASNVTISDFTYRQWGKVATLRFACKCTTAITASAWTTLATIVSGKRPSTELAGALLVPCIAANVDFQVTGVIRIRGAISANSTINLSCTYIIEN